ncbi:hypothetical protein Tco_0528273 [Tanacetum coccineum]
MDGICRSVGTQWRSKTGVTLIKMGLTVDATNNRKHDWCPTVSYSSRRTLLHATCLWCSIQASQPRSTQGVLCIAISATRSTLMKQNTSLSATISKGTRWEMVRLNCILSRPDYNWADSSPKLFSGSIQLFGSSPCEDGKSLLEPTANKLLVGGLARFYMNQNLCVQIKDTMVCDSTLESNLFQQQYFTDITGNPGYCNLALVHDESIFKTLMLKSTKIKMMKLIYQGTSAISVEQALPHKKQFL